MGLCSKAVQPPKIPTATKENLPQVLQQCYDHKIAPMERRHCYDAFHNPPLMAAEFNAKPMILFLGQVSSFLLLLKSWNLKYSVLVFSW